MFEVRRIISVFSEMRLERKKFGNHWSCIKQINASHIVSCCGIIERA